ncbi:hypothetical protein AB990_15600 [Alkalihalobacillus pseudalcaliphilus]|nr:hypothetical protein AB990_15600 [Alkalihalobacillus pseudalcaliphilus]
MVAFPKVNKHYLAWQEDHHDEQKSKLYLLALNTEEEEKIQLFEGNIFFYDISDDYLVWQSNNRIYGYSFESKAIAQLDDNGFYPYINGKTAVWERLTDHGEKKFRVVLFKINSI